LDEVCIVSKVGGVCGLGVFWVLIEVYVLGGLYNLDVACFLDEDCTLSGNYSLCEGSILGGAVVIFVLGGYVVVRGMLYFLVDWVEGN
jgi:hypothetical protein